MCPVGHKDWSINLKMFFCRNILFVWFLWLFLRQLSFQWKCLPQFSELCSPLHFQTFCTWWHSKWFCHWPWWVQELSKLIWVLFLSFQAWVQNLWVLHWELQIKNRQNLLNAFFSNKKYVVLWCWQRKKIKVWCPQITADHKYSVRAI